MEQSALRTWVWCSCGPNHEYWCKCTWRTNSINKTATSDRLDLRWQLGIQWHRRGIELVFKSLDCLTRRLFHSSAIFLLLHMYLLLKISTGWLPGWRGFLCIILISIWWGSTQLRCTVYLLFAPYTDPYPTEGISAFQTSLLFIYVDTCLQINTCSNTWFTFSWQKFSVNNL